MTDMTNVSSIESLAFLSQHLALTGDPERPYRWIDEKRERRSKALWRPRSEFRQIRPDGKPNRRLIEIGGKRLYVARVVWILHNQQDIPAGMEVDHTNRDPLDNRPENLRLVDGSANQRNSIKTKMNGKELSSRYPGVYWDKANGKWRAQLHIAGAQRHLGRYPDELIAAHVVDAVKVLLLPAGDDLALHGASCTEPGLGHQAGISPEDVWTFIGEAKDKHGIDIDAILTRVALVGDQPLSLAEPAAP